MIQVIDPVRFDAFVALMALPDPRDLPHRGHVCRYAGDPDRRATRLPGILMGWLQRRHLAVDGEEALAPVMREAKRHVFSEKLPLRVLRPTGSGY
jgi:hypothetical protein